VDAFLVSVASGALVEGYGFDPDYGDCRAFCDETWTFEMSTLLDDAGRAFLTGQFGQCRAAYRRLLEC
jgi:hypothetical protein